MDRQSDYKSGPDSFLAFETDRAAILFYVGFYHGKSETAAIGKRADGIAGAEKFREKLRLIFDRYADARVDDADLDRILYYLRLYGDRTILTIVADSIGDEVLERVEDMLLRDMDGRQISGWGIGDYYALLFRLSGQRLDHFADQLSNIRILSLFLSPALIDTRYIKQVIDQADQPSAIIIELLHRFGSALRQLTEITVLQKLHTPAHAADRRT